MLLKGLNLFSYRLYYTETKKKCKDIAEQFPMREAIGESIETVDFWPACHVMKEHNLEADLKYGRSITES